MVNRECFPGCGATGWTAPLQGEFNRQPTEFSEEGKICFRAIFGGNGRKNMTFNSRFGLAGISRSWAPKLRRGGADQHAIPKIPEMRISKVPSEYLNKLQLRDNRWRIRFHFFFDSQRLLKGLSRFLEPAFIPIASTELICGLESFLSFLH
jgi:hypothetical protein